MNTIMPLIISSGILTFVLMILLLALVFKPAPSKKRRKVKDDISKIKREISDIEEEDI
jgi:hypothetical protein